VGSSFCGGCVTVVLKFLLLFLRCYPEFRSSDSRLTTVKRNELVSLATYVENESVGIPEEAQAKVEEKRKSSLQCTAISCCHPVANRLDLLPI